MYKVFTFNKPFIGKVFVGERDTWDEAKALAGEFTAKNQKPTYILCGDGKIYAAYHSNMEREENNK